LASFRGGEFSLFRAVWFFLFGEKKKGNKKGEERK
jgi:cbb3-type cytochrome oxidase subunit 3